MLSFEFNEEEKMFINDIYQIVKYFVDKMYSSHHTFYSSNINVYKIEVSITMYPL